MLYELTVAISVIITLYNQALCEMIVWSGSVIFCWLWISSAAQIPSEAKLSTAHNIIEEITLVTEDVTTSFGLLYT